MPGCLGARVQEISFSSVDCLAMLLSQCIVDDYHGLGYIVSAFSASTTVERRDSHSVGANPQ